MNSSKNGYPGHGVLVIYRVIRVGNVFSAYKQVNMLVNAVSYPGIYKRVSFFLHVRESCLNQITYMLHVHVNIKITDLVFYRGKQVMHRGRYNGFVHVNIGVV